MTEETLRTFADLLRIRFERGTFTTEDAIRYTFLHAMTTSSSLQPDSVVLEARHPGLPGAEVDTVDLDVGGMRTAIEFKYDREIPSGRNAPRPQKAGQVFRDLYRLAAFRGADADRLFVYCDSEEMIKYLRNARNGLADFFGLPKGESLRIDGKYIEVRCPTFRKSLGGMFAADIVCLWACSLPKDHELRIYRVLPI